MALVPPGRKALKKVALRKFWFLRSKPISSVSPSRWNCCRDRTSFLRAPKPLSSTNLLLLCSTATVQEAAKHGDGRTKGQGAKEPGSLEPSPANPTRGMPRSCPHLGPAAAQAATGPQNRSAKAGATGACSEHVPFTVPKRPYLKKHAVEGYEGS